MADPAPEPPTDDPFDVLETTWPAAGRAQVAGWLIRTDPGGGKRVMAASPLAPDAEAGIDAAEAAMRARGQTPLFRLTPGDAALDAAFGARGYRTLDPTVILAAPVADLAAEPLPHPGAPRAVTEGEVVLAAAADFWAAGGIGPERLAVMARVSGPKTYLFGRDGERLAAVGFVALARQTAMLHALEVGDAWRRRGHGRRLTAAAARWAQAAGASWLTLAVTEANAPALALYRAMGFGPVASYHYRLPAP